MSTWDRNDLGYEDYDPNKDYSVQVQRNDGGLASTQRSLQKIEESKQLGAETCVELHRQGEVLKRAKEKLDESEVHLRESEGHLKGIKSFWGQMTQKWFGPKPRDANSPKTNHSTASAANAPSTGQSSNSGGGEFSSFDQRKGDPLTQKLNQSAKPMTRDEQINSNLNLMSSGLADLKNLGLTLQSTLEDQDELIDDVDHAVQRNKLKQDRLNKQMNNLLKKKWIATWPELKSYSCK